MINYNISLNKELAQIVEQKMKQGKYANRSEFFRELLRRSFIFREKINIDPILPADSNYKKLEKISKEKDEISNLNLSRSKS
ncbi:hypothetical protein COV49_01250 [Candidatus Falkowbacteria bacterium CG11_big_fil_rev_8_21_14_0_20_39_10]|uniref:Uncharacterized protein n=1 Tax=Candidatus Falkowbacteria bacterium CG11_big_fil_rev_8_21_14_0_20_39_10 TaxID=1974570 RepID=A0A2M6K9Z7_9BACT|nr:MAG: hypothetical protein COV49_01250 [Candidatus Falkowbacteria bacterium CG11_big_fil_rev_8_21_14_0_20_39_10]